MQENSKLSNIVSQFLDVNNQSQITPISTGLINDTYLIDLKQNKSKYILQKINKNVFPEPEKVMKNLINITKHLHLNVDNNYELLTLTKTKNESSFLIDDDDEYWRLYKYIDQTRTVEQISDPNLVYEAAKAFGNYIKRLVDLDPKQIFETIKYFHNYRNRVQKLEQAIQKNAYKRLATCIEEVKMVKERLQYIDQYYSLKLPVRIIHSDTKIDNILFDDQLKRAVCVIDLDISMPGSILYDFGDMVRYNTNSTKEDDPNIDQINLNKEIFHLLSLGFIEETFSILTTVEKENLLLGAKLVILIQAIRYLTDYLSGDIYYKIQYDSHNIIRTKNQLHFLKCVEREEKELLKIINSVYFKMDNTNT